MRLLSLAVVIAFSLSGCRDTTSPDIAPLLGSWADTPQVNRDGTTYRELLTLNADHSFIRTWRMYQQTGGSPDSLRAYAISQGTFGVRNDSLFMRPNTIRTWDRLFNGGQESISQVDYAPQQPGQADNSGAQFEVTPDILRLHYLSYPADGPVETEMTFLRAK